MTRTCYICKMMDYYVCIREQVIIITSRAASFSLEAVGKKISVNASISHTAQSLGLVALSIYSST